MRPMASMPSVPGASGIHWSHLAVVAVYTGSMLMTFVPCSRASMMKCMPWIWETAGFDPQMTSVFEFTRSVISLPWKFSDMPTMGFKL